MNSHLKEWVDSGLKFQQHKGQTKMGILLKSQSRDRINREPSALIHVYFP